MTKKRTPAKTTAAIEPSDIEVSIAVRGTGGLGVGLQGEATLIQVDMMLNALTKQENLLQTLVNHRA